MTTYRTHCHYCEGRGQAPAWRTGLTHDSICPVCSGSGFADTEIATLRATVARMQAVIAAARAVRDDALSATVALPMTEELAILDAALTDYDRR